MSTLPQVEARLSRLEHEVAGLRRSVDLRNGGGSCLKSFIGSFKDDPHFEEIARLGREFRQAQLPESHG